MVSSSKSALLTWHRQFDAQCPAQWHCRDTKANGRAGDYVPAARMSLPAGVVLHRRSCAFELRLLLAISGNQQKSSGLVRTVSRLRVHAPARGRGVAEPGVYPFAILPKFARDWGGHRVQPALICRVLSASPRGVAFRRHCGWRRCNLYSSIIGHLPIHERPYAMNRRTPTQVRLRPGG